MDQKFISDSQYHELAMMNGDMVRSHKVKAARKSMSSCISVKTFGAESSVIEGAHRSVNDILDFLFTMPEFFCTMEGCHKSHSASPFCWRWCQDIEGQKYNCDVLQHHRRGYAMAFPDETRCRLI